MEDNILIWIRSPLTQDINWMYIRRSENVVDVLCTFNLRPVSTALILEAKFGGGHYLVMPLAVAITAWKVSECWKIRTGKTSNTNTFHAVNNDGKTGWIVNPVINSINQMFLFFNYFLNAQFLTLFPLNFCITLKNRKIRTKIFLLEPV